MASFPKLWKLEGVPEAIFSQEGPEGSLARSRHRIGKGLEAGPALMCLRGTARV